MYWRSAILCLAWLAAALVVSGAAAQEPPAAQSLEVFLDCQGVECDFDHFRREIGYVTWVRDRQDAEVHVLITGQPTGGGGREFTFTFIGLKSLAGKADTLRLVTRNTDTPAEIRDRQVQLLKLGLVRYVAATPAGQALEIGYRAAAAAPTVPARDPWNLWVFTAGLNANLSGEKLQRFTFVAGSLRANRTAEDVKLDFSVFGSYNRSSQALSTGTYVNVSTHYGASQVAVWSAGPHWSFGLRSSESSSTFYNTDLETHTGPAIEYDLYPYDQSTRRQLTIRYSPEVATFDYEQETLFFKTAETLTGHRLDVSLKLQQPWGQTALSARAVQYWHDLSKHRLELLGFVQFRVFRGLDLSLSGSVARVKDQIYLPRAQLSDEEILVRRRQLGTDFQYFTFVGLSFRFGSKVANVVNSRMPGLGGGGTGTFAISF